MTVISRLEKMHHYFHSGETRSLTFRKEQLNHLKLAIIRHEEELHVALHTDLKKSPEECWVTETGLVISEINTALKNLGKWMTPEKVSTNLVNLPSASKIHRDPLGIVLIIGPWNYPFQLLFNPLVGAIAAGNCVVLKPSEFAPATEAVMKKIIDETFDPRYILYVEGEGQKVIPEMMNNYTFDHVFYTGSTEVGRIIYKMAAEKLVPVTLELGGKSPCVVESDANIKVAVRRITMTKFSNAGQMCVAPDYLLVHSSVIKELLQAFKETIPKFFGDRPLESYNYGKIINLKQFDRIAGYLSDGTVIQGGGMDRENLYIEPTILTNVSLDSPVMKNEIFGPVLPVLSFNNMEEAKAIIQRNPNPLSFYIYTASHQKETEWLDAVPAGGACVNNSSWHLTNHNLPFGGRGFSGKGSYHGKHSFETFSHRKAVMKTPVWFDPNIKYPPFKGKMRFFKMAVR